MNSSESKQFNSFARCREITFGKQQEVIGPKNNWQTQFRKSAMDSPLGKLPCCLIYRIRHYENDSLSRPLQLHDSVQNQFFRLKPKVKLLGTASKWPICFLVSPKRSFERQCTITPRRKAFHTGSTTTTNSLERTGLKDFCSVIQESAFESQKRPASTVSKHSTRWRCPDSTKIFRRCCPNTTSR